MPRLKYQTDNGSIFYTIQEDDTGIAAIAGAPPTGEATEEMTVRISKNTRQVGIRPRYALLARKVGTDGEGANGLVQYGFHYRKVAILTDTQADTLEPETTYTIAGVAYTLKRVVKEDID